MDKSIHIAFIRFYEEETKKIIGKIDTEILKREGTECLCYAFPLIERLILEIFKLVPEADIEQMGQGIMKTPISIIENNNSYEVLPSFIIDMIKKYYGEDGARNRLFHVNSEETKINVNFEEIIFLTSKLLQILKYNLKKYDEITFNGIETIK